MKKKMMLIFKSDIVISCKKDIKDKDFLSCEEYFLQKKVSNDRRENPINKLKEINLCWHGNQNVVG